MVVLRIAILSIAFAICTSEVPRRCIIEVPARQPCGYEGIPEDYCYGYGCCYDNTAVGGAPWCYTASSNRFVDNQMLTLLALDDVPVEVIFGLYADVTPGAEWLLAFHDGNLNTKRLLNIIVGKTLNLPPLYAKILAGEDPVDIVLAQVAESSGFNADYLSLILDGKTEIVLKHTLYLLSAQNQNPAIPYNIIQDLIEGDGLDSQKLLDNYIYQLLPPGDKFRNEFYKSLLAGDTDEAIQWAYLSALQYSIPLKGLYPKNAQIFSAIVRTQKDNPGLISPSLILAMAKGDILPGLNDGGQTFEQLFGVSAKDFVCAAHQPDLETTCEKLKGRLYITSKECLDAGCCLIEPQQIGDPFRCYENVLGNLGVYLAQSVIDEDYIRDTILGGTLPAIEDFIPWAPNNDLPSRFTNWLSGVPADQTESLFIELSPTAAPLQPSIHRPNFKWKPHGPTAFPFNPKLPYDLLVPTESPGVINPNPDPGSDSSDPLIAQLTLNGFGNGCRAVQTADKVACISNSVALSDGGEQQCLDNDCCYDPNYSDLGIPACFRLVSYGQCYKVDYGEREECGEPGISREKCLENPQCCYDTALPVEQVFAGIPWCYYKKRAPLLSKDQCSRAPTREQCFESETINSIVNQATCESVGCCFDDSKPSWFDVAIELSSYPVVSCYKPGSIDLTPTEEPDPVDPDPATEERCQFLVDGLSPHERADCGHTSVFACRVAGCCYEAIPQWPGYPWCFSKSVVEV